MASPLLSTVSWAAAMIATLFGLISFGRGIAHLWRQVAGGAPAPGRWRPVGRRLGGMLTAVLSHREFKGRRAVKIAHWFVMISFPLLFLTLVTGYAQLRNQTWSLPLIGHLAAWEWLTELFAWGGLIGILLLMAIRTRAGAGAPGEAALSGDGRDAEAAPPSTATGDAADGGHFPRDGSPRGMASRFLGSTRWQARFVEWVILLVCLCVVVLRGLENALYAASPDAALASLATPWHFPTTAWIGALVRAGGAGTQTVADLVVVVSAVKICVSMAWMMVVGVQTTMGVAWHRFLAVVNLYARREPSGAKALGPAAPMLVGGEPVTDVEQIPDDADLGAGTAADLTWKDRLDFYSCTECGRCQELCPAWNTQKPLSPKLLVLALRDHMDAVSGTEVTEESVPEDLVPGDGRVLLEKGLDPVAHTADVLGALAASGATGPQGAPVVAGPLVPEVVSEEALWDCTMCGACVDQCPVDIEHVDHILDLRRHQVLMEGAFPQELGRAFRGMETKGSPYNLPARRRLDWARDLDFDVPVIGEDVESAADVDYLFWVGCAGASDDRAKRTTAAVAELLHTAGVTFAVLGSAESCTGDPARRAGNEVLFQMLASTAIDTLHEAKAQRIVVTCAHCFNTIAGEFPQLGGRFDVIHHTQLLNRLVRDGRLRPVAPPAPDEGAPTVTYHDPCFLGRHNRVYEPPRELLGALPGLDLVEMPRNRDRAMCCGAGGARAWMEETRGIRIADARMAEAASTGAQVVATACPFCSQMLGSATGSSAGAGEGSGTGRGGAGGLPEVKDVALLLLDGVRRGQAAPGSPGSTVGS
ncbi:MAG: 4Fe-4S dicluster domain-containing protein [Actinomyces sp.]|jgi:Fe-S oxidoreductase|nr:(Fe-S)-binding protein [Actinomyces sp.]MCI1661989.1 4Fe-4S dicluster domain-containing protein [Actinomyces sp.]